MKNKRKLKRLAAKYVGLTYQNGRPDVEKITEILQGLKSLPRSQAIYIISKFLKGLKKRKNQNTLLIESAIPLSKLQIEKIVKNVRKEFVITEVKNIVNPGLLGGFKITIGDVVLDYTFTGKLSQLRQAFRS